MVQGVVIEKGHIVDVNPATGEVVGRVPVSTPAEVDAAVAAARAAQPKWAALSLADRTEKVRLAVHRIGDDADALARMITLEMGKTLRESEEEVADNADKDEYCGLVMQANEPERDGGSIIVRHPHGVVSICSPWNYPVEEIVLLSIPALIAGNAVVIKPSEVVPLSGEKVVKALMAGLNCEFPGLVNLLQGDGEVGSKLVAHPGVDMVSFTGSTATGAKILKAASETLKPAVLECGGKDPMVVMADADLEAAAKDAVDFSLANCGQVCCAVERVCTSSKLEPLRRPLAACISPLMQLAPRLACTHPYAACPSPCLHPPIRGPPSPYVHHPYAACPSLCLHPPIRALPLVQVDVAETVAKEFEAKVVEHAKTYIAGNGLEEKSTIGPMVSELQRKTVHRHVQVALKAGARCMLGGQLPASTSKGTFYPPTVLAGVPHDAKEITQEETFGPVVALSTFDGSDEAAVPLANDSTYGLTASVYSGDVARASRIAARLSAGQVGINNNPLSGARALRSPFVGHKRSGYNSHSGTDGWRAFSTPKTLIYREAPPTKALPMQALRAPSKPTAPSAMLAGVLVALAALTTAVVLMRR